MAASTSAARRAKRFTLWRVIVIAYVIVGVGVACLYPRPMSKGGLGGAMIVPGDSAYRETYRCLGVPQNGTCFGLRYDRRCDVERFVMDGQGRTDLIIEATACQSGS